MQSGKTMRSIASRIVDCRVLNRCRSMRAKLRERIPNALIQDVVMSVNRLVAGCTMLVIMVLLGDQTLLHQWALPVGIWNGCALGVMVSLRLGTSYMPQRRIFAVVLDVVGTTLMLAAGGGETAFLYAVYLWIIIGYGFRFGGLFMLAASLLSIAGFATVILTSPFWHVQLSLSAGLLVGLAVLPAYSFGLVRQLARARKRAEQADAAKSLFLAGVSHELRTPLHAIMGTVELLQRTQLDASQAEMVATVNTAAGGQLSLVQDLLEFSRVEAGYKQAAVESFDLPKLLAKVTSIIAVIGRSKGLTVNFYVTARTPLRLKGVERYIREVLLNLGGNAVKFTSTGSVTIAVDGVKVGGDMVRLRIEVMDTGIGIAPENSKRIFSLFTQANDKVFNRFGGTGLGLALCEKQVGLMNGTIGVDSTLGAGSTFWINLDLPLAEDGGSQSACAHLTMPASGAAWDRSLRDRLGSLGTEDPTGVHIAFMERGRSNQPLVPANIRIEVVNDLTPGLPCREVREEFATSIGQDSPLGDLHRAIQIAVSHPLISHDSVVQASPPPAIQPGGRLAGLRVLVADDNALNRSVLSRMLEHAGVRVTLANDGEEALAVLTDGDIDLAFIDVNMPVMDGVELAELYAFTSGDTRHTPLIGLTADGSEETRVRCLKAGMRACLVKPIRSGELMKVAENVLGNLTPALVPITESTPPSDRLHDAFPPLDSQTLSSLEELGGVDFVKQILLDYKKDGFSLVESLGVAHAVGDVHDFRFQAHSIASISANVGAKRIRALCLPLSHISESVFHENGAALMVTLLHEWGEVCTELGRFNTASPVPIVKGGVRRFG